MRIRIWNGVIAAVWTTVLCTALLLTAGVDPAHAQSKMAPDQKKAIEEVIRAYLLENPELLVEALDSLERRKAEAEAAAVQKVIAARRDDLIRDPGSPVSGPSDGDVTLVEFFDYRCGVCRRVHPIVAKLIDSDKKIRRVYKEWPILGPKSIIAARAALASRQQGKYFAFHNALMEAPGDMDEAKMMSQARKVGLDVARLRRDMKSREIDDILRRNFKLADALKLRGTPSFVIGDQLLRGGRSLDTMREFVARARKPG
jgi:protein-disulfide isomerase